MKTCANWFVLVLAALAVTGCDSSPYNAGDENLTAVKPPIVKPDPIVKNVPAPIYTLSAPTVQEFTEGTNGKFQVSATIQNDQALVNIENPPAGSTFDATTGVFDWTPGPADGHDPADPRANQRIYPLFVDLRGAKDLVTVIQKTVLVIVRAKQGGFSFASFPSFYDVNEGSTATLTLQLADDGFPTGPFVVTGNGLPDGMTVTATADPTKFNLAYLPSYRTALSSDRSCAGTFGAACKAVTYGISAINPAGKQITSTGTWNVHNVLIAPRVEAPTNLRANGSTATFSVYVEDLNGENLPSVSATTDFRFRSPNVNQLSSGTSTVKNPDGVFQIDLSRTAGNGTPASTVVVIKSCVSDATFNQACTNSSVTVNF